MNQEKIINGVIDFLRQHENHLGGTIHQEPYTGDLFRLFVEAFDAGLINIPGQTDYLSADALSEIVASRAPDVIASASKAWDDLRMFWAAWTYAWKHSTYFGPITK